MPQPSNLPWQTAARESRRSTARRFSRNSIGIPECARRVSGWDWPSPAGLWRRTAGRSGWKPILRAGRYSNLLCPRRHKFMITEQKSRVLVVDDEPQILRVLRRSLERHGFDVVTAAEAATGLQILRSMAVQLVITDLRMPDMSGVELCREIRRTSNIPLIIISVKGEEETKVAALDAGADDYVTKPFGMQELMARVRALSRRASIPSDEQVLCVGKFRVDSAQHRVFVEEKEVRLTPKEYDLLAYFLANHSKVLTHRAVLKAVWGENSSEQAEYLRVFVGQLRKKIERDARTPRYIITEPWIGYRFNPAP